MSSKPPESFRPPDTLAPPRVGAHPRCSGMSPLTTAAAPGYQTGTAKPRWNDSSGWQSGLVEIGVPRTNHWQDLTRPPPKGPGGSSDDPSSKAERRGGCVIKTPCWADLEPGNGKRRGCLGDWGKHRRAGLYLDLVPATHQSGRRCYHGPVAGSPPSGRQTARWRRKNSRSARAVVMRRASRQARSAAECRPRRKWNSPITTCQPG